MDLLERTLRQAAEERAGGVAETDTLSPPCPPA